MDGENKAGNTIDWRIELEHSNIDRIDIDADPLLVEETGDDWLNELEQSNIDRTDPEDELLIQESRHTENCTDWLNELERSNIDRSEPISEDELLIQESSYTEDCTDWLNELECSNIDRPDAVSEDELLVEESGHAENCTDWLNKFECSNINRTDVNSGSENDHVMDDDVLRSERNFGCGRTIPGTAENHGSAGVSDSTVEAGTTVDRRSPKDQITRDETFNAPPIVDVSMMHAVRDDNYIVPSAIRNSVDYSLASLEDDWLTETNNSQALHIDEDYVASFNTSTEADFSIDDSARSTCDDPSTSEACNNSDVKSSTGNSAECTPAAHDKLPVEPVSDHSENQEPDKVSKCGENINQSQRDEIIPAPDPIDEESSKLVEGSATEPVNTNIDDADVGSTRVEAPETIVADESCVSADVNSADNVEPLDEAADAAFRLLDGEEKENGYQNDTVEKSDTSVLEKPESNEPEEQFDDAPNAEESVIKKCIRKGCENIAVNNPEWEQEFCSNECVVLHCKDVFLAWIQERRC